MNTLSVIGLVLVTALVADAQTRQSSRQIVPSRQSVPSRQTTLSRCEFGWYRHVTLAGPTCLWASKFKDTWLNADTWCNKMGGHLAEVDSAQTNIALTMLIRSQSGKYWIGLTDVAVEGQFQWMQSRRVATDAYTYFQSGKGRGGVKKNCVYIDEKGFWGDEPCKGEFWFICQK